MDLIKRTVIRGTSRGLIAALCMSSAAVAGGCANAQQGALSGAGIGALSGLAIGSLSGNAGKGAAIGAIAGGVGGAVIGDQNRRRDEAAAAAPQPPAGPPPGTVVVASPAPTVYVVPGQPYSTGQNLGRLIGQWRITDTIDSGGGATLSVLGSARGTVDKTYFVRLDCSFNDPRTGTTVEGSSYISQSGGLGVRMSNSFSSSPEVRLYNGQMDPSGNVINFTQYDPPASQRQIVIHMSAGRDWTADVWDTGRRVESYTFQWLGP